MISQTRLIGRLAPRGIHSSMHGLSNDVRNVFLPPFPIDVHADSPLSDDEIVTRATRLYRLRKRSARGEVLRILLFLSDGWGWDHIKPTCLRGFDKCIAGTQVGIRDIIRKPTPNDVAFAANDIAAWQEERLRRDARLRGSVPPRINPETMRFVWGLGLFGKPLEGGSLRSFALVFKALDQSVDDATAADLVQLLEFTLAFCGLSWAQMRDIIQVCDANSARRAVANLRTFLAMIRRPIRRAAVAEGSAGHSSNPLTLFGYWRELTDLPQRLTPAQILGAFICVGIVAEAMPMVMLENVLEAIFRVIAKLISEEKGALDPR